MKKYMGCVIFSVLLFSACSSSQQNTDQAFLQLTAAQIAETVMAETIAAIPPTATNTSLPPTETATATAIATATDTILATFPPTSTQLPAASATVVSPPLGTATRFFSPNKLAPLKLTNNTKLEIRLIIQNPGYQEYNFTTTMFIEIQYGRYDYIAWIGGEGPYTGSMFLNNPDKYELIFDKNGVTYRPP